MRSRPSLRKSSVECNCRTEIGVRGMESATFRKWLSEQGCRFDRHEHEQRHEGQVMVTVHREDRKAEVRSAGRVRLSICASYVVPAKSWVLIGRNCLDRKAVFRQLGKGASARRCTVQHAVLSRSVKRQAPWGCRHCTGARMANRGSISAGQAVRQYLVRDWNVVISVYQGGFRRAVRALTAFGRVDRSPYHNVLVMRVEDPDSPAHGRRTANGGKLPSL